MILTKRHFHKDLFHEDVLAFGKAYCSFFKLGCQNANLLLLKTTFLEASGEVK